MLAASGIAYRGAWILGGLAAGMGGAMLVAAGAGTIASAASGMGQEMLNAAILLAAVVMLGWHNLDYIARPRNGRGRQPPGIGGA